MIDCNKIFLDSSPIIYFLEEDSPFKENMDRIFYEILKSRVKIFTSTVTCTEYLTLPYRFQNDSLIKNFWQFIYMYEMNVRKIDNRIAVEAAKIRAEYKHIKTADALQLAAAVCSGCDLFLTNDKQLRQFDKISCMTVEEWTTFSKE